MGRKVNIKEWRMGGAINEAEEERGEVEEQH